MEELKNYIGGEWTPSHTGLLLDNFEPATGKVYGKLPDSDHVDVGHAVAAAKTAFPAWSARTVQERSQILRRIARGIEARQKELALAESIDTGKPLKTAAQVDIPRSSLNFDFFADAITQVSGESHSTDQTALNFTLRQPLGVVACISPWNLPLYLLSWKVAPALAAGNCVVAKPSEITPVTASWLTKICHEAGLPPGVFNVVHGNGQKAGAALVNHRDVAAVSFTGSTKTGADITKSTAGTFKKLSLEMGGKNPNIIFADCNFEEALVQTVRAAFSNQGQICLCGSRIFVEKSIFTRFKAGLLDQIGQLKIGDPMESTTDQGALVSEAHFKKVLSYIELARQEGGKILTGGAAFQMSGRCKEGWFVEPTLIEGLSSDCRVNQEEIFGPVATLIPFETEDEVLAMANSTRYGLAASVWTQDISRAHRMAAKLASGIVWINCWMLRDLRTPFGGVKESGVGREGGLEAFRFFTEPKNVCVKL